MKWEKSVRLHEEKHTPKKKRIFGRRFLTEDEKGHKPIRLDKQR